MILFFLFFDITKERQNNRTAKHDNRTKKEKISKRKNKIRKEQTHEIETERKVLS